MESTEPRIIESYPKIHERGVSTNYLILQMIIYSCTCSARSCRNLAVFSLLFEMEAAVHDKAQLSLEHIFQRTHSRRLLLFGEANLQPISFGGVPLKRDEAILVHWRRNDD